MAFQSSEQTIAMDNKVQWLLPFHVHHIGWNALHVRRVTCCMLAQIHGFAIAKRQFWCKNRGLRTWGFNFFIDKPLSLFFSSRGPKSNQDSCLMYAAVVFNNSRGFSQRHWNDLTYRNILRFTFMEPFVEGILFGTESLHNFHQCRSCRRTGSGVASRMCGSANER